jgi:uncharacterized protein (DUF362 family)
VARRIAGATTTPQLIAFVVKYFSEYAKEVFVIESDSLLNTADEAFDNLGIREAVEDVGCQVVNLSVNNPLIHSVGDYDIPHIKHDLLVNLPVLKTHEFGLLSCAMKNLFGLIPSRRRIKYHPLLADVLVRLCEVFGKQLVIVDALCAMEGHGPTRGKVIPMNVLIGSRNPIAIDLVACQLMGIEMEELSYLHRACKLFGVMEVKVRCHGVKFEKLCRKFKRPELDPLTAAKMWVWRHRIPNYVLFASPFYKVTRAVGLPIRKFIRHLLKMEKID